MGGIVDDLDWRCVWFRTSRDDVRSDCVLYRDLLDDDSDTSMQHGLARTDSTPLQYRFLERDTSESCPVLVAVADFDKRTVIQTAVRFPLARGDTRGGIDSSTLPSIMDFLLLLLLLLLQGTHRLCAHPIFAR